MDIHAIRRTNLQKLISQAPSQKAFAESIDTAPAYISQIVSKIPRASGKSAEVGNNLARKIEEKLGLAKGWMDSPHDNINHASRSAAHFQVTPIINSIQQFDMQGLHECKQFGTTTTIHGVTYVPIVGNATMGADGFFMPVSEDNRTGDGWVPAYANVGPYAYGIRGLGDCLYPAIRPGWIPVFDPEKALVPTAFVHVNLKDGRQTIKEFIAIQDGLLHLQAINGNRRITFDVNEVQCIALCVSIVMPHERISELPMVDFGNE